jgi:simple sugar transport system permease protein
MTLTMLELVLFTILTAATPLVIAAIGELVTERSGVLNLGVEGMMIAGAACAFAIAIVTGSTALGILAGIGAGMLLSTIFAVLVIFLAANQVATGLALTIMGTGLAGLVGSGFIGLKRDAAVHLYIPLLSDLPLIGKLLFSHDLCVYLGWALVAGVAWFLNQTRSGLVLRAIGENHHSAHALGLPVRRVRFFAVLFGGACAGLAGAYLSLSYTPFWAPGMTAGRGWIALALVVFASWQPLYAFAGALLFGGATVLQLHAQAAALGIPGQLLTAVPYLATIVALVILSIRRSRGSIAPASLGSSFMPER